MTLTRSQPRLVRKLQEAFGSAICTALEDTDVVEVMLNPDGLLFVERIGQGIGLVGSLSPLAAEIIIGSVAHALQTEVSDDRPIVSGKLPIGGHRFEGLLPPVVAAPTFSIRRRAVRRLTLDAYVEETIMTEAHAEAIRDGLDRRSNILIAGGTGSGKTTLANAVLAELAERAKGQRLLLLEDTPELECDGENVVALRSSDEIDMDRLLKSTLRLRPDRIIVGEVRDGAALTLLKAWNTGHPGGLTTLHANSAAAALRRLEQLVSETSRQPMREVIAEAVDLVVFIGRAPQGRVVREVLKVAGFSAGRYELEAISNTGPRDAA